MLWRIHTQRRKKLTLPNCFIVWHLFYYSLVPAALWPECKFHPISVGWGSPSLQSLSFPALICRFFSVAVELSLLQALPAGKVRLSPQSTPCESGTVFPDFHPLLGLHSLSLSREKWLWTTPSPKGRELRGLGSFFSCRVRHFLSFYLY